MSTNARCAAHPEVAAVDVCKRCGRFLCGECLTLIEDEAWCSDCVTRRERPASRLSRIAAGLALASWLLLAFTVLLLGTQPGFLTMVGSGVSAPVAALLGLVELISIGVGRSSRKGLLAAVAGFIGGTLLCVMYLGAAFLTKAMPN